MKMTVTPELCRAIRAYFDWTQDMLAQKAGVGTSTVRDFERGARTPIRQNLLALERVFNDSGIDLELLKKAFPH